MYQVSPISPYTINLKTSYAGYKEKKNVLMKNITEEVKPNYCYMYILIVSFQRPDVSC